MNILCALGLHHATWNPIARTNWLHTRICARCGKPLPQRVSH